MNQMTHDDGSDEESDPPQGFSLAMAMHWLQKSLILELSQGRETLPHPGEVGDNTELKWIEMLSSFLPQRYSLSKAFVVDVHGRVSDQIDVVIYDKQYSPQIFRQGVTMYVPAESVYAVFEVKQDMTKGTIDYTAEKLASVRTLTRTSAAIPHAGGIYKAKEPAPIIGGLLTLSCGWVDPFGKSFEAAVANWSDAGHRLDLGCAAARGAFATNDDGTIGEVWPEEDRALVWFVTRLLARLQMVATVPAIDIVRWASEALGTPGEG